MRRSAEEEAARIKNYEKYPGDKVSMIGDQINIGDRKYRLIFNYREGFNAEKLEQRFSNILAKYDYIVGDWGYEQLRLKGFYQDFKKKVVYDKKIETLIDYLYEYCNFGCSFFVLEKLEDPKQQNHYSDASSTDVDVKKENKQQSIPNKNRHKSSKVKSKKTVAFVAEKTGRPTENQKPIIKSRAKAKPPVAREVVKKDKNFTIKKRNQT
ncbi:MULTISPECIES: YutD family protein [unclassified Enterococcus]|uniref:YutD family protein n=1 Tax=unclassified Enterococcus TaxID=2608891 RepID=UPI001552D1B2|nr:MULTISPECIES: YutD family protein [unclassified Enterococcus]MBS7577993.1 YutD family protein [Enterococcus sp. MMGLQ5-2]MBS7585317.1 YutD family protein [Enterococcus sp. MMGLQ5-1]NPD13174.1 YutD family protein [Enterococcus sp. MMGLQ5-1]NPD37824.1 YutD family protein [Enterococcus sp. MMGLQ5-2]